MTKKFLLSLGSLLFLSACGGLAGESGDSELAHTIGDVMSGADEGFNGAGAALLSANAVASTCASVSPTACSGSQRTLTYSGCTVGPLSLTGTVTFYFSGASACSLGSNTDFVRRVPDFSISGRSGGTLRVGVNNTSSGGQTITRVSASTYTYEVSGLRRIFVDASNNVIANFGVSTTTAITISGATRATRRMMGGTLKITNNLDNSVISLSPDSLKWNSSCNCPVSGSWVGQRVDSSNLTSDVEMEITGCGAATLTVGAESSSVSLERCGSF
jgi:hypothetical protein